MLLSKINKCWHLVLVFLAELLPVFPIQFADFYKFSTKQVSWFLSFFLFSKIYFDIPSGTKFSLQKPVFSMKAFFLLLARSFCQNPSIFTFSHFVEVKFAWTETLKVTFGPLLCHSSEPCVCALNIAGKSCLIPPVHLMYLVAAVAGLVPHVLPYFHVM